MNKTVYLTFDEASRLVDACKDSDGVVTKKFFDWYLGEPKFFARTGVLVIDNFPETGEKTAISFDFSDPDAVLFISYRYSDQKQICKFRFFRQENLTINNVSLEIIEYSKDVFTNGKKVICAPDTAERAKEIANEIALLERKRRLQKMKKTKREILVEMGMNRLYPEINKATCRAFVYYIYAMMYNFHNQKPEEFLSEGTSQQADFNEKVRALYSYSGYVKLTDNKIYRPIVKKDPDDPTREYQRHIQKWIVRGHYRRTANGLIWIEEHIKGQGELEKRVYGTSDESEVPVVPKVFEVFRAKRKAETGHKQRRAYSTLATTLSLFIGKIIGFLLPDFLKKDSAKT